MATRRTSFALSLGLMLAASPVIHAAQTSERAQPVLADAVRAACDEAYAIVARTPGVHVTRRTGRFTDETLEEPVFGCGFTLSGSFKKAAKVGDAVSRLHENNEARGWSEMFAYSADGPDGTSFALRKGNVSCLVRGMWDGGADDEPDVKPADWYKATFFCTSPAFPEGRTP